MNKFKKGDRVVAVRTRSYGQSVRTFLDMNRIYKIVEIHPGNKHYVRINGEKESTWWFEYTDFKLVEKDFISYEPKNQPKE